MIARGRQGLVWLIVVLALLAPAWAAAAPQEVDAEALLATIREKTTAAGLSHFLTPVPGSRSVIVAVDVTAPMYVYVERGSIRGSAIDTFYAAYAAGDIAAAYQAFRSAAVPTARVTDYGWNGLGVPWVTDEGNEISDVVYRSVDGVFGRAPEITAKDIANYVAALRILVDALDGS